MPDTCTGFEPFAESWNVEMTAACVEKEASLDHKDARPWLRSCLRRTCSRLYVRSLRVRKIRKFMMLFTSSDARNKNT